MKLYYTYSEFKDCPEATEVSKNRAFLGTILTMASFINLFLSIIFLFAFVSEDWTVILYAVVSIVPVIYMLKYYPIVTDRKIRKAIVDSHNLKSSIAASKYNCQRISLSNQHATGSCRVCLENNKPLILCTIENDIGTQDIYICDSCISKFTKELLSGTTTIPANCPSASPAKEPKRKASASTFIFLFLLAITIVAMVHACNSTLSSESSSALPSQIPAAGTTQPTESIKRLPTPANGKILFGPLKEGVAPLTVKTTTYDNCYLILTEHNSAKVIMSFFVRANSTADVSVPVGNYDIYYAVGEAWYGTDHLFGDSTYRAKFDESFLFTKESDGYSGWTIEMQPVSYGNLESDPVSADDFPN